MIGSKWIGEDEGTSAARGFHTNAGYGYDEDSIIGSPEELEPTTHKAAVAKDRLLRRFVPFDQNVMLRMLHTNELVSLSKKLSTCGCRHDY
jgi:hypothetical protein